MSGKPKSSLFQTKFDVFMGDTNPFVNNDADGCSIIFRLHHF